MLTRLLAGPVLACPETKDLCIGASTEVVKVAHAVGVALSDEFPRRFLELHDRPTHRPSMYHDLNNCKRLELEALNGTVVRMGRAHGIDTPINFAIYAALKPYINGPPALP